LTWIEEVWPIIAFILIFISTDRIGIFQRMSVNRVEQNSISIISMDIEFAPTKCTSAQCFRMRKGRDLMRMAQTDVAHKKSVWEKPLPLVIEIIPGQAEEGLIDIYEPGTFEHESLYQLIKRTLGKEDWSLEDRQIIDDIRRQLSGGKLLCKGREIEGTVHDFTELESTGAGEQYFYLPVRAIKPQEGGV
jgi:hypothetical protein